MFIDERGRWITPDLISAFLEIYYFIHHPELLKGDRTVLHDIRSSNSLKEFIREPGSRALAIPTGHTAM